MGGYLGAEFEQRPACARRCGRHRNTRWKRAALLSPHPRLEDLHRSRSGNRSRDRLRASGMGLRLPGHAYGARLWRLERARRRDRSEGPLPLAQHDVPQPRRRAVIGADSVGDRANVRGMDQALRSATGGATSHRGRHQGDPIEQRRMLLSQGRMDSRSGRARQAIPMVTRENHMKPVMGIRASTRRGTTDHRGCNPTAEPTAIPVHLREP
jgi:hypothetical protein